MSKSEIIIADALNRYNVPYRYEFPLQLKTSGGRFTIIYPDFTCLNLRTRQEFLWEHFGLIEKPDYVHNAASKLELFSNNKIVHGKNLIITMETEKVPLDTRQIEQIIKEYLL